MSKLDFIRIFMNLGIACIPLHHRSKTPILSTWGVYQNQLPTQKDYHAWFCTDWNNYGIICGWQNLVVLDFDTFELFDLWRAWMKYAGMARIAENAFKVITSHGMHVYLCTNVPEQGKKRISKSNGIDVQGVGRYVVGPGCVHPSGTQYVAIGQLQLIEVESVEQVLPVDLFPPVSTEATEYNGAPIQIQSNNTEYLGDPLTFAQMDLISKVKASVRIEDLYTGVQRSSVDGRWLKALCPFHKDSHQSAWIDTVKQIAGCQVCQFKPLDVINVYARMKGLSNTAAVTALAAEVGVWR